LDWISSICFKHGCGAETICFGSSSASDFQKVSALTFSLVGTCLHGFSIKMLSFHDFFGTNTDFGHLLDPVQDEL
jgi:hypothetical protein